MKLEDPMGPRLTVKLIRWESEKRPNSKKDYRSVNLSKWHITEDGQFTRCGKNVHAAKSDTMPYTETFDLENGTIVYRNIDPKNVCRSCLRITGLKV